MKNMKKLLVGAALAVGLVAVLFTQPAVQEAEAADGFGVPPGVIGGSWPGAYAAITNNTIAYPTNAYWYLPNAREVNVQVAASLSAAGSTPNGILIYESVDGVKWQMRYSFVWTPNGTTEVVFNTNLVNIAPWVRVYSISNANANTGYVTNYSVKIGPKPF